jgi:excinuclease ABC subunit C
VASPLLDVRGVGRKLAQRLMARFGSLEAVKRASVDDLSEVAGISVVLAHAIHEHWRAASADRAD